MARGIRRSVRRNDKSGLVWTATSSDGTLLSDGDTFQFPVLVVADDITGGSPGQVECTLLRIRGWVSISCTAVANNGIWLVMAGAAVYDDNDVSITDWRNVLPYTREDVLWTAGGHLVSPSAIPVNVAHALHFDIDIKAKRRLKSGQQVRVEFTVDSPSGAGDTTIGFGAIRSLVKLR